MATTTSDTVGVPALRRRSGGRVHLRRGLTETTWCGALTWTAGDTDLDLTPVAHTTGPDVCGTCSRLRSAPSRRARRTR
ncbi:hypothetical protein DVS28_b0159 (plasmid) [Euzebya pacifica]|uniref:Uncharacterized protein n=1 Tax=Euzebya pacifica TaxID=1608957 RepID=A0A346Y632_9ACTN|nr:hypothetical protein [Euzebya pacifica]AXV09929.1 hypothetical protein DVS28_b0159 [Euzebya pacifica]